MRLGSAIAALGASLALPTVGLAQTAPLDLSSSSFTRSVLTDPTPQVRIDGILGSGPSPIVSLLATGAFGSPASNAAVASVGVALTSAAAPVRVQLSAPRFVGRAPTERIVNGTPFDVVVTGVGAVTIPTGARGVCATGGTSGLLGDGGDLPAGCQNAGTAVAVGQGQTFILTNTNTPQIVLAGSADVYAVTATPIAQIGTGHTLTRIGTFQDLDRLTDRLFEDLGDPGFAGGGDRPWAVFAEAFGGFGRLNADPSRTLPGARTEFGGISSGIAGVPLPGIVAGWIFDASRVEMATNDPFAPESSRMDLVKTGPFGSFRLGDFTISFLAVGGRGDSATRSGSAAAGGVASAGYGMTMATGGGEVAMNLRHLLGIPLTPQFGYQFARVETEGFAETGSPFALRGQGGASERQRLWFGAIWSDSYEVGPFRVEPRAYLRVMNLWGDTDGASNAVFAGFPQAGQVNLSGPQVAGWAAQWGLRARIPLLAGVAQVSWDGQSGAGYDAQVFAARFRLAF
jgi:hypothetical protein